MPVTPLNIHSVSFQDGVSGNQRTVPSVSVPQGTSCLLFTFTFRRSATATPYIVSINCDGNTSAQYITQRTSGGGGMAVEFWYLKDPPTGDYDIVLNYTPEVTDDAVRVYALSGTDPDEPLGAFATGGIHSTIVEGSITLQGSGSFVAVAAGIYFNRGPLIDEPVGWQQDADENFGPFQGWTFAGHLPVAGEADTEASFSGEWENGGYYWALGLVEIKADPGGPDLVTLDPLDLALSGAPLDINARTQMPLLPLAVPWTGSTLEADTKVLVTLGALQSPLTGSQMDVNAKILLDLAQGNLNWLGQDLDVREMTVVVMTAAEFALSGQDLIANAKTQVPLEASTSPFTGSLMVVGYPDADLVIIVFMP